MITKRKKSNRLRPEKKTRVSRQLPRVTLPNITIPWRTLSVVALVGLFAFAGWRLLDQPVRSIAINAPFQRVTAMQIEDVVRAHLSDGLLSTDLGKIREELKRLPWIDDARVRRQWPDAVVIGITEQLAAARWGNSGLLNTRGELFIQEARHVAKELPLLVGPAGEERLVAERYLQLQATLLEYGFNLLVVTLDDRGAWSLKLSSDVEVRLGRERVDERLNRFLDLVTPLIAGRAEQVEYIDMRYANGFAIGWVNSETEVSGDNKDV